MSLMGVDVGTTGIKAVVFSETGKQLSIAYEEYQLQFPFPGASELDSQGVIDAAMRVIGKAAGEVASTDPVMAIGLASQGEAFTPIDANGRILGNAMTSSDCRAASFVETWGKEHCDMLYRTTGHTPYPLFSIFKLMWIKENQPEVWESMRKILFFEDLIAWVLTGEAKTDYTMAARSMLFDINSKEWSSEIVGMIGLDPDVLPEVVPPGGVIGKVKSNIASQLGLSPDVTVVASGHDQPVGALGCGAALPGTASYAIGTVECICPAQNHMILTPDLMGANLATYPHVLPDTYTTVAFNVTGGSVLKWVRDNFATAEADAAKAAGEDPYVRIIAAASDEPSNLILIPQFGPTGTPHFDSTGAGVLFGLKLSTKRSEVIRAFLEGITYEMKWNLSILDKSGFGITDIRVIGGGSKSDTWMQIKSDILGVPLTTMQVTEATCMGTAILAGGGVGILDPAKASAEWAKQIKSFEPKKENVQQYEDKFAIYKEIYNSLAKARQMLHSERKAER